jgi:polysaccharide deacetylase 2 family uncharacterized protein YibQ
MAARDRDDETEGHWFFKFLRGAIAGAIICVVALIALSLFVLPPAELPPPVESAADSGPKVVDGIEVATAPVPAEIVAGAAAPQAGTGQAGTGEVGAGQAANPAPEATAAPAAPAPIDIAASPALLAGPALEVNAAPFEAPEGMPLVAVVLDDTAADPLLLDALFSVKLPLTIGVVAGRDGDREVATRARAAGMEVVAQLPLAAPGQGGGTALEPGLTPGEAGTRTEALIQRLPMAVAASRPLAAPGLPDPATLQGMAAPVAAFGYAYLDHGVSPGEQSLLGVMGLGLSLGTSRYVLPAGSDPARILVTLDQAATDAGPGGGAVILAAPSQTLLDALLLWGGEGSVSAGALAPLSAVIARQGAG